MDEQLVPVQYILYTNHSVAVSFADGSELKLSPCSSVFLHLQPPGVGQHALQSKWNLTAHLAALKNTLSDLTCLHMWIGLQWWSAVCVLVSASVI